MLLNVHQKSLMQIALFGAALILSSACGDFQQKHSSSASVQSKAQSEALLLPSVSAAPQPSSSPSPPSPSSEKLASVSETRQHLSPKPSARPLVKTALEFHRIIPNVGNIHGNEWVAIYGRHMKRNLTILIGSQPCTSISYISSEKVFCRTGSYQTSGEARVVLQNKNESEVTSSKENHFKLIPSTRARKVELVGTEAHTFIESFANRLLLPNSVFLDEIIENGMPVSISEQPKPTIETYIALHSPLNDGDEDIEVPTRTAFSQNELMNGSERLTQAQGAAIVANISNAALVQSKADTANPEFNSRTFSPRQTGSIEWLTSKIYQKINQLEMSHEGAYYMNSRHLRARNMNTNNFMFEDAFETQAPIGNVQVQREATFYMRLHENKYDREHFVKLLQAIQTDDETAFLRKMVQLATVFADTLQGSREAFIQNFATLFVTKQFASRAAFLDYSHFAMRCGIIH